MGAERLYRQCRLEKREGVARIERTTWLPESFAVEGRYVKLRDADVWSDGWRVVSASGEPLPEKYVVHMSHAHTRQRRASDV